MKLKLIDLLVQELPKRGGWPEFTSQIIGLKSFMQSHGLGFTATPGFQWFNDSNFNEVTREQYEAALAASKQTVWIPGELPPIGAYAEVIDTNSSLQYGHGENGEVLAHVENTAVIRMSYGLGCFTAEHLRPAKSEAERKREEAIEALSQVVEYRSGCNHKAMAGWLYEAIAAGKIPSIKRAG